MFSSYDSTHKEKYWNMHCDVGMSPVFVPILPLELEQKKREFPIKFPRHHSKHMEHVFRRSYMVFYDSARLGVRATTPIFNYKAQTSISTAYIDSFVGESSSALEHLAKRCQCPDHLSR